MVGKQIIQIDEKFPINYGCATIPWGDRCEPRQGIHAGMRLPAGWRSPTGEITQDRDVALGWARDLDALLAGRELKGFERRAA